MHKITQASVCFTLLCLQLSGCGGSNTKGPKRYPVTGKVTLDGKPLEVGAIKFVSFPEVSPAVFSGASISHGQFALPPAGMLPAGKYLVTISSATPPSAPSEDPAEAMKAANEVSKSKELIPKKYNDQTTLKLEVTADKENVADFDLKSS